MTVSPARFARREACAVRYGAVRAAGVRGNGAAGSGPCDAHGAQTARWRAHEATRTPWKQLNRRSIVAGNGKITI
jgi:hypothetical protein